jgi:hypothetical protein
VWTQLLDGFFVAKQLAKWLKWWIWSCYSRKRIIRL